MLATILYLVIALCLIATVIWAFQTYVTIPAPFGWIKGIVIFVLIVLACYFVWDQIIAGHMLGGRLR